MSSKSIPYILLQGFLFGTTLVASRFSVGQYHPTNYVGIRLVLAALAHIIVYLVISNRRWPRNRLLWKHGLVLGVFGTAIPMTSIVTSLQYQSSGLTSILLTTGPAITVVFAHFLLEDEKLTFRKISGVILAFSGAILLALLGENGLPGVSSNPIGYLLVIFAMLLGSGSAVYVRRYLRLFDSFDVASVRMMVAAIVVLAYTSLGVGFDLSRVTAQGYGALIYASLSGTFLGMILLIVIIQKFGATPAAMTSYVIPVVASFGGALLLNETITAGMLGGMGLIVGGIAVINHKQRTDLDAVQA